LIREEYTDIQQIVIRDWYYTCAWIGSMFISWLYYGFFYVIFRKPSSVVHYSSNDPCCGSGPFPDGFDGFDYYNDIEFETRDRTGNHTRSNGGSKKMDADVFSHHDDEFFDAMMFSLGDDCSSSNHSSVVFLENLSRLTSTNDRDVAPLPWVTSSDDNSRHEDSWEDLYAVDVPVMTELAPPLANVRFPDQERLPSRLFPTGHQTLAKSLSDHTSLLEESCDSPNVLPGRVERIANFTSTTTPLQIREASNDELEGIWMDFVDKNNLYTRSHGCSTVTNGVSTNFSDDDCCDERHPFFVFCHGRVSS
jgi:hypothetical protein